MAAIRYAETSQIKVSDDISTDPKFIRLDETVSDTDITTLSAIEVFSPLSVPALSSVSPTLPAATCKWLYIKPAAEVTLSINGGTAFILRANKATKIWATITSVTVANAGSSAANVTLAIGA